MLFPIDIGKSTFFHGLSATKKINKTEKHQNSEISNSLKKKSGKNPRSENTPLHKMSYFGTLSVVLKNLNANVAQRDYSNYKY